VQASLLFTDERIINALKEIQWGKITITIQDSMIVLVEKLETLKLNK
jgi:hypothetical protein